MSKARKNKKRGIPIRILHSKTAAETSSTFAFVRDYFLVTRATC